MEQLSLENIDWPTPGPDGAYGEQGAFRMEYKKRLAADTLYIAARVLQIYEGTYIGACTVEGNGHSFPAPLTTRIRKRFPVPEEALLQALRDGLRKLRQLKFQKNDPAHRAALQWLEEQIAYCRYQTEQQHRLFPD